MYYQNYDDYMRDVFYFNQMPNQNMGFQNCGFNQMNPTNQFSNYNNMYPSIYRIIQPVVSRVVTGSNYQYLTEDSLNSMVDTVYNIVEGDVTQSTENMDPQNSNSNSARNQSGTQSTTQQSSSSTRCNDNSQNSTVLLKDLIKIMVLKEIMNRNNIRRMPNSGMYQNQFYPNCYEQRYMY